MTDKSQRVKIGIVVPYKFDKTPEQFGGGYVRLSRIFNFLDEYLDVYKLFYSKSNRFVKDLVKNCFYILRNSYIARKHGLVAVVAANPSPIDVRTSCIISKIARAVRIVYINAIPLTGYVGYRHIELNEIPTLQQLLRIIRDSGKQLPNSVIESIEYYILFRCLKDSIIVPLTPDISLKLEKIGLKCIEPISGVGCTPNHTQYRKWIDAVYVASPLHPDKGIYDLIDIWEIITRKMPNSLLVIVGREDPIFKITRLKKYIEAKGLKNIKIFASKQGIPNNIIIKILSQAKLFVYPTKKDVTPLVVSEALGCGTPVVTYNLPGIELAYKECEAVIRVDPGNKEKFASEVLKLLSEQKNLEKLEIAAVKWCTNNSWRKIALKTAHAYIHALLLGYYMKRPKVNLKR
jgi:glycosyltransferase involved in cell wall biosynthesis